MYVLYVLFGASCARGEHVHHTYRDVLVERMEKCNAARTIIARSYRSCHQENGYSISMAMRYPWALMECGAVLPLALEVPNNVVTVDLHEDDDMKISHPSLKEDWYARARGTLRVTESRNNGT